MVAVDDWLRRSYCARVTFLGRFGGAQRKLARDEVGEMALTVPGRWRVTAEGSLWTQGRLNMEKAGKARWAHTRIGVSDASGQVDLEWEEGGGARRREEDGVVRLISTCMDGVET